MKLRTTDFPCCRAHDLFDQPATYAMAIKRSLADEVYWFNLATEHGDGSANVQVARLGNEAMLCRVYQPSTFGKVRRSRGALSRSEWSLIEDAVVAADFWMLDEHSQSPGLTLGGADWVPCRAAPTRLPLHHPTIAAWCALGTRPIAVRSRWVGDDPSVGGGSSAGTHCSLSADQVADVERSAPSLAHSGRT
jgi:hypothetical protein